MHIIRNRRFRSLLSLTLAVASLCLALTGCEQKAEPLPPTNATQSVPANAPPGLSESVQGSQMQGQQANQRAAAAAAAMQAAQQKSGGK